MIIACHVIDAQRADVGRGLATLSPYQNGLPAIISVGEITVMHSSPVTAKTAWSSLFVLFLLTSLLLAACGGPTPSPQTTPTRTVTPSATQNLSPTATPAAVRTERVSYPGFRLTPIRPTQPPINWH